MRAPAHAARAKSTLAFRHSLKKSSAKQGGRHACAGKYGDFRDARSHSHSRIRWRRGLSRHFGSCKSDRFLLRIRDLPLGCGFKGGVGTQFNLARFDIRKGKLSQGRGRRLTHPKLIFD
jgi:hypothetical protein